MGIGVVESSRHLCGHASTISDVIRPKDSTKIKDLTLIFQGYLTNVLSNKPNYQYAPHVVIDVHNGRIPLHYDDRKEYRERSYAMKSLFRAIRVAWLFLWASIATIILCMPVIIAALLSRTGNLAFSLSKIWAYVMLAVSFVRTEIKNKAKLLKGTSYIIISNHQSHFDILALVTTLGIQFRWLIKKEILKIPLFGYALYASRNIFIDRSNTARAIESINKGLNRLPKDAGVMVFAEGTRSPDGQIHEFKKGGFIIAIARKMPILRLPSMEAGASYQGKPHREAGKDTGRDRRPHRYQRLYYRYRSRAYRQTRQAVMANFDPEYAGRADVTN